MGALSFATIPPGSGSAEKRDMVTPVSLLLFTNGGGAAFSGARSVEAGAVPSDSVLI